MESAQAQVQCSLRTTASITTQQQMIPIPYLAPPLMLTATRDSGHMAIKGFMEEGFLSKHLLVCIPGFHALDHHLRPLCSSSSSSSGSKFRSCGRAQAGSCPRGCST